MAGRPKALEKEDTRLQKALSILSNIHADAAAGLIGLGKDFEPGSRHDGALPVSRDDGTALECALAEMRSGQAELRTSEAALAVSRAETKAGLADLMATRVELAAAQAETTGGLADLVASAVELAAARAETKVSVNDLLAGALALSVSRAETIDATNGLRECEGQIKSILKTKALLRNVVEGSPTALILVGAAGRIEMVNAKTESMFGYTRQEMLGQKLETLLPQDFCERHVHPRGGFMSQPSSNAIGEGQSLFGRRKDGSQVAIEIGLQPIVIEGNMMVVAGINDITERSEAERAVRMRQEALEQANNELIRAKLQADQATRAKSRFLAGMSHELRTPLNGILGNARLLQMEGELQPAQVARVNSMLSAGNHLLEMIHCVLDLSEIETERVALRAEPVDLRAVMNACLDIVRHLADEKGLGLNLSVAAEVPQWSSADPVRLRQILLNLLGNAAKFTRRGGFDLRLGISADGDSLRFEVADSGPGIPRDKCQALFQDFARVQTGESRTAEGAGLGLALSARLAALMGGRLGHMDNPRGGSIFWLELPLLPCGAPEARDDGAAAAPSPKPEPVRPLHVLVVDDSEMNLDIAASFIRIMGHKVSCANGGAEAVAEVAATPFDLVLMDVQMPDMDGLQATRLIRGLPGASGQVPVVAMTAQVFTEQLETCRQAGMSGHLGKPFTEAALYATLARYVPCAPPERRSNSTNAWEEVEPEAPVIDLDVFRTNTRLLKPASVIGYLENIAESAGTILSTLRAWDGSSEIGLDVLKAAHKLAGNVGLFGFARAADAARRFERAARSGTPETHLLAESLAAALQLSIREADARLEAARGGLGG
jgi:PAS domain S-box-containing protein